MRIRTRLFMIIGASVLVLAMIYTAMVFVWQSAFAKDQYLDAHFQMATSSLGQLDEQLNVMNSLSLSIAYSNLIKDEFKDTVAADTHSSAMQRMRRYESYKLLSEMVFSIVGPVLWVPQVYIYSNDVGAFGNGLDNGYRDYPVYDQAWYSEAVARNGGRYVTSPMVSKNISGVNPIEKDQRYVSLVRAFFSSLNLRQGFVEIMQRDSTVFSALDQRGPEDGIAYALFRPGEGYVYKGRHFDGGNALLDHYDSQNHEQWVYDDRNESFLLFLPSAQSEFVLMSAVPYSGLTRENRRLILMLSLTSTLVALLLTPVILSLANTVSSPINQLYHLLRSLNLETIQEGDLPSLHSNILEIVELDKAFRRMRRKINESMQKILLSEKHETQARMLALQAQTNPHFLYNTFASIAAMSSAGMNDQIEDLCENISALLRYISSDKEKLVTVRREIEITQKFVACMQARFPLLQCRISIPPEVEEMKLPKLAIQLLVENSIKYAASKKPPWIIDIVGGADLDGFFISVHDNGAGFADDTLIALREKMEEIHRKGVLPSLELEGMGLLNLFIRMDMMYRDRVLFTIENNDVGATVTIGFKAEKEG